MFLIEVIRISLYILLPQKISYVLSDSFLFHLV